MNIFVGSLSFKTTEQELQREFEAFGEVGSVKIIMDRETLKSRGFAFVEMRDRDQALAAIAGINGKELAGQILKANEAKPREARGAQSRERTGGGFGSGDRPSSWGGFGNKDRSGGGFGNKDRAGGGYDSKDGGDSIYDSKGGNGSRGRGGRGSGSGGRSGGGRRPPR
jgi:RNA recognition motif-containing protein